MLASATTTLPSRRPPSSFLVGPGGQIGLQQRVSRVPQGLVGQVVQGWSHLVLFTHRPLPLQSVHGCDYAHHVHRDRWHPQMGLQGQVHSIQVAEISES
jgi:hypothetical protein